MNCARFESTLLLVVERAMNRLVTSRMPVQFLLLYQHQANKVNQNQVNQIARLNELQYVQMGENRGGRRAVDGHDMYTAFHGVNRVQPG